ncbi:restriction endonuclease [Streptomyces sp. NPDC058295]|uniref:restriction endonuclease n=1 Tax=Streptomyces sp. NPDC058295 TaxID=3346431 RepID=UPI0036E361D5
MARRKTVMQVLAEAYKAKQQAKAAELKRAQQKEQRAAKAAEERRRGQKREAAKAEAEHARLLAAGEKHLNREQAAQAREVARIERELAKRQAERERTAEQQEREQTRAEKERQKQARETRLAQLKDEAEQRTLQAQERMAALQAVLTDRPKRLKSWHPYVEQTFADQGPQGVADAVEEVLSRSPVPEGCRAGAGAAYVPEAQRLLIEVELPQHEVLPTVMSYRVVAQRVEIVAQPRKESESKEAYRTLVARLALRALDEAFSTTPPSLVTTVVFNGHVSAKDRATGRPVRPCLVSVVAQREDFDQLVLDEPELDPQRCLKYLGAVVSRHPHDLEPVPPVVEIDLSMYRITADAGAVAGLDSRPDLLQMDPYAFERLVRELFEAMGFETWRTQGSRDDGVDAVAVKRDPVGTTVFAIQAKRSKNAVPVETVRALAGVMHDKAASRGVLVTTSWFGKASDDFAHRTGRMQLINGRNLKALLKEYLNMDVLIGLPKTPPGWQASDVQ